MENVTITELIEEVVSDICDNYCKYRHTCDENAECEVIRSGETCPLDIIMKELAR